MRGVCVQEKGGAKWQWRALLVLADPSPLQCESLRQRYQKIARSEAWKAYRVWTCTRDQTVNLLQLFSDKTETKILHIYLRANSMKYLD